MIFSIIIRLIRAIIRRSKQQNQGPNNPGGYGK